MQCKSNSEGPGVRVIFFDKLLFSGFVPSLKRERLGWGVGWQGGHQSYCQLADYMRKDPLVHWLRSVKKTSEKCQKSSSRNSESKFLLSGNGKVCCTVNAFTW